MSGFFRSAVSAATLRRAGVRLGEEKVRVGLASFWARLEMAAVLIGDVTEPEKGRGQQYRERIRD